MRLRRQFAESGGSASAAAERRILGLFEERIQDGRQENRDREKIWMVQECRYTELVLFV